MAQELLCIFYKVNFTEAFDMHSNEIYKLSLRDEVEAILALNSELLICEVYYEDCK
jgi:hypothetical protein